MTLVNMVVTHFLFSSFTASNALKFLKVQHVKCEYVGLQKDSCLGKLEHRFLYEWHPGTDD